MNGKIEIFVFIDALGWDLVEATGFLGDVLPHRRSLEMQFGYSCSAVPTILSGTVPAENGHLSLFRFAPEASPFRRLSRLSRFMRPASFWRRGRVRSWLSKAVGRWLGFTGYFQLYSVPFDRIGLLDYCEKRDLFASGGMAPIANLRDRLESARVKHHVSDWHLSDAENLARGVREIEAGTDFLFLYTSSLDAVRHIHPIDFDAPSVKAKLEAYAKAIRELVEAARKTGREWRLTIFSDHGMTPLTKTVDIKSAIEATGLKWGEDYGACYDSTMFRVHYLKPGVKERLASVMKAFESDGHFLSEDEERGYGILRADRAFGDEIFLVNPGVQLDPCDMGAKPLAGMHGYDPADVHSRAAIMSTEPIPDSVRAIRDVFGMMTSGV